MVDRLGSRLKYELVSSVCSQKLTSSRGIGCGSAVQRSSPNTVSVIVSYYFEVNVIDRVYGLVSWPQKTDKTGALVRKYCECLD